MKAIDKLFPYSDYSIVFRRRCIWGIFYGSGIFGVKMRHRREIEGKVRECIGIIVGEG